MKTIVDSCVMQTIRVAARKVTRTYERALRPVDLTASQFSTMIGIGVDQGVGLTALAERVGMDRTTLPRVLAPLERRNLVNIEKSKHDVRSKEVFLTDEGIDLLNEARGLWTIAQADTIAELGEPNWNALQLALLRLS